MKKKFLLIDVYNLFHRCKHVGMGDIELKTGMALHITLNSIRKMWKEYDVTHIVACLEGGSWRKKIYPDYKANRKVLDSLKTPRERKDDEYYFEVMNNFITFLDEKTNVTVLKERYAEADDFIARWIQVHPNDDHIILTSDSDFYQLLSDNVKIHDGVKGWTISHKEVLNEKNQPAVKVSKARDKVTKKMVNIKTAIEAPNPEYELFKKCIRGDSSDNIMSAYPKVREKGTRKKPGIIEAFEDRFKKGLTWNEFMLEEWDKVIGHEEDEDGNLNILKKKVRVKDEYEFNRTLIDLTMQPQEIIDSMDKKIVEQIEKEPVSQIGVNFLRFVTENDLQQIASAPTDYAKALSLKY